MKGEPVVRLRGVEVTDRYGATVLDWTSPSELVIDGCALAPRMGGENHDAGRQGVIIGWTLLAPTGSDIGPKDRIQARGFVHEVDGQPEPWVSPFTDWAPGIEIALRRIEG